MNEESGPKKRKQKEDVKEDSGVRKGDEAGRQRREC